MKSFVVALVAALSLAPTSMGPYDKSVISIEIETPRNFAQSDAMAAIGLKPGDHLDQRTLRKIVKRLYLLGQLADVEVWAKHQEQGIELRFVLVPARLISAVIVDGAAHISNDEITNELDVQVGMRLEGIDLSKRKASVQALYKLRGFPHAHVEIETDTSRGAGDTLLRVRITEGQATCVSQVTVIADSTAARSDVHDWVALHSGDILDRKRITSALEELTRHDRSNGYLEAGNTAVHASSSTKGNADDRVDVRISYRRGPRYSVSFRGAHAIHPAMLRGLLQFDPEEELGPDVLASFAATVTAHYRRSGYPHAAVHVQLGPGPQRNTRRVLVRIDEGERSELDSIKVVGASGIPAAEIKEQILGLAAESIEEESALGNIDPGDIQALLSEPAGRPKKHVGVEYPMGAFSTLEPTRVYDENFYQSVVGNIEDLYSTAGFLQAHVSGPRPRWRDDRRLVEVVFNVDEGHKTVIHSLRFSNNQLEAQTLLEALELQPGNGLDLGGLEEARLKLLKLYADKGYAFARVFEYVEYNADKTRADIHFVIDEGPQVNIGRVLVQGNEQTSATVIFDRLSINQGDMYSGTAIESSRQRVLGLGLFSSVEINLVDADIAESTKDLLVDVRERKARIFEWNAGVSVEDGPRSSILLEHRNVLGLGVGVRSRLKLNYPRLFYDTLADKQMAYELNHRFDTEYAGLDPAMRALLFTEAQALLSVEYPKIFGIPVDTAARSSVIALRENRSAFTLNKIGLILGTNTRPVHALNLGTTIELEGTDFLCYAGVSGPYQTCGSDEEGLTRRQDNGQLGQLTLRQEIAFDRRDNPIRPHVGFHISGAADLSLGGGLLYGEYERGIGRAPPTSVSANFVKLNANASGYLPLTSSLTLAIQARVGNIVGLGSDEYVPLYKKYYLGGSNNLRGFDEDRVLPVDYVLSLKRKYDAGSRSEDDILRTLEGASSGGRFFVNVRTELRIPVVRNWDFGIFLDAGELVEDINELDISQFSLGGGAGARWNTPVGPIALDFGWALKDPGLALKSEIRNSDLSVEERLRVHLSIGYF